MGSAGPCRRVRVVARTQDYGGDGGFLRGSERSREHRDALLYRREAQYFCNTRREDRPAGPQPHLRSGDAVTSQPGVRGQGSQRPRPAVNGGEDALLWAIMNLQREADYTGRRVPSSSRVSKHHQNTPSAHPQICTTPEKHKPSSDLSGGSKEASPPASVSPSKIFFSDQDKIPGLGRDPEEPTLEEHCSQAIINKAREIEKLYKQDCETLGMVVKMLISKDPALEQKLLTALKKNLVDIKGKCLENLSRFISEVNALLKSNHNP